MSFGLRHRADRVPVALIAGGVLLALLPFAARRPLSLPALVTLGLVSLALRVITPVHQHVHAHHKLFGSALLNHAHDVVLMLAGGNVTAVWELQHVHGHHRALLTPGDDPANSRRFTDGGRWHRVIFTLVGDFVSLADSVRIARKQKRPGAWLLRLGLQTAVQLGAITALLVLDWRLALALFVVRQLLLRWSVFYFSYAQHHDMPNHDVYSSSVTHFHWSNAIFLNIGHHTAHHEKPTLHWSELPRRTAAIKHRIPDVCLQ